MKNYTITVNGNVYDVVVEEDGEESEKKKKRISSTTRKKRKPVSGLSGERFTGKFFRLFI